VINPSVRAASRLILPDVDGRPFELRNLLQWGDSNPKLAKGHGGEFLTAGLSLAPSTVSGYQTSPLSTPGCRKSCIFTAGMAGVFSSINRGRIARTIAYFEHRDWFLARLGAELARLEARANAVGKPTSEVYEVKLVVRALRELYADTSVVEFGPLCVKAARQWWVSEGRSRTECNRRVALIKRIFKWAVSEELAPPDTRGEGSAPRGRRWTERPARSGSSPGG